MNGDSATNAVTVEHLSVKETDDSCRFEFIEIVPITKVGTCTTECVSGDWLDEVKQENFAVVKQEPDDVCGAFNVIIGPPNGTVLFCMLCFSASSVVVVCNARGRSAAAGYVGGRVANTALWASTVRATPVVVNYPQQKQCL